MKRKRVWRYYCEHCGKGGCSAGTVARHEAGCTANPQRTCGMCEANRLEQQPMSATVEALLSCDDDYAAGLEKLRDLTEGCPACILAAIRQSGIQQANPELDLDFDFKAERDTFWQQVNEAEQERYAYGW